MDISFYVLLTLACMVLLLAMWACAASSTTKWGPDLTLELPPHVLQEALFGPRKALSSIREYRRDPVPSAPSELPYAPLLCNEQPVAMSRPPMKTFSPPSKAYSPPSKAYSPPVKAYSPPSKAYSPPVKAYSPSALANMGATVLVLPPRIEPQPKMKPVFYKFSTEEPA